MEDMALLSTRDIEIIDLMEVQEMHYYVEPTNASTSLQSREEH